MDYQLGESNWLKRVGVALVRAVFPLEANAYRPALLASRWMLFGVAALLAVKMLWVAASLPLPKNIFFAQVTSSDLVSLLNEGRAADGLAPLKESSQLDEAAQLKAQDMEKNNYFAHVSPQGVTPWHWFAAVDYRYSYAGENLAVGFFDSQDVYQAWLNSPEHRANMQNPNYQQVGTAVLQDFGSNHSILAVQLFGTPAETVTASVSRSPETPVAAAGVSGAKTAGTSSSVSVGAKASPAKAPAVSSASAPPVVDSQSSAASPSVGSDAHPLFSAHVPAAWYQNGFSVLLYMMLGLFSLSFLVSIPALVRHKHHDLIFRSLLMLAVIYGATLVGETTFAPLLAAHRVTL